MFGELVELLTLNPTVNQLLAAGYTCANGSDHVHQKQQVEILVRTPFYPVDVAEDWHPIDVCTLVYAL